MDWLALIAAIALALVHLFAGHLKGLVSIPRSRWLSAAGGVSVAYVFVHILPELAEHQGELAEVPQLRFLEEHVYLVALVGMAAFYGLERLVSHHRKGEDEQAEADRIFWVHIGAFSLYNALIGFLLVHRRGMDAMGLWLYAGAMALHFLVNDHALRDHHRSIYEKVGRWVLAASTLAGWAVAMVTGVDDAMLAVLFAAVAGAVILNVLKEELPDERESCFSAFLGGAAAYTVLLILL